MKQINVPSRSAVATNDRQARAIQDLYSYISEWKEEIDAYIDSADADFKGTFNSLSELQALIDVDANDYGYVISTDDAGNTVYNRYRYVNATGWVYEYSLNNPSFTVAEWAAIHSGATAALMAKLTALPTSQEIVQSLSERVTKTELASIIASMEIDELSGDITIEYDDGTTVNSNE